MRSLFLVSEIHWHGNPIVLIIDLFLIYPFRCRRAIERRQLTRVVCGRNQRSRLQIDLRIKKIEMENVLARAFVIFISLWSLLSGCASTRQAAQADSNSSLREPESDHEAHGEVGVMYGHSAR
jgi:hypothetical protein